MYTVSISYSECEQIFVALLLSHGLVEDVILLDVHLHL